MGYWGKARFKILCAGYEPLMPTFQGHISEEELFQLIAYIKSLPDPPPAPVRPPAASQSGGDKLSGKGEREALYHIDHDDGGPNLESLSPRAVGGC